MAQQQRGIDCRQAGPLLFDANFISATTGLPVTTGTATCQLFEVESDGTLLPFDFSTNAFLANNGIPVTATISLTARGTGTGPTASGYWSAVLATTTGLTAGGIYLIVYATVPATAAPYTMRKIQWGLAEGDLVVGPNGGTPVSPLGLLLTALAPDTMAMLSRGYLTTSGVTSPVTADVEWTIATTLFTTTTGTIASTPYYVAKTLGLFAWTDGTFFYITSTAPGVTLPSAYFKTASGAGVAGPYTAQGTATGVPAVIYHGNAVLNTIQPNAVAAVATPVAAALLVTPGNKLATDATGGVNATQFAGQAITAAAGVTLPAVVSSYAGGAVASVAGAVGSVTSGVTVTTNNDKTGYALSAAGLDVAKGWGTFSARQTLQALAAVLFGKRSGMPAAGSAGTITYVDNASVAYGTASVDTAGNITSVSLSPPA